ncbi:alpha-methylacyl-CoA racemase [Yinghuangia aomiensis]|uniref:Alpha-methylacyl-CoA racemase n=1 Tax=Yinghuangia aomiensis TaxID=676205 RepID=A0ABP9HUU6_9ACTN
MAGPLDGLKIIELAGIGPGPHAAMLLADLGADVVRVERPQDTGLRVLPEGATDWSLRNRRVVYADLKQASDLDAVLDLTERADVLVEGFRPGVAERLGIGPDTCLARNRRLIYARMTGWGQHGPWARTAGHDINYLAVTGILHAIGSGKGKPVVPLNLLGDFGGGSLYLAFGVLCALRERERTCAGQVVDAAIVDGATSLAQLVWTMRAHGEWTDDRAANLLDGAAPFYDTYVCADGKYVAVGALEPQFFALLLDRLGLDAGTLPRQDDRTGWPVLRTALARTFAGRTRDAWAAVFDGSDACVTPVLTFGEAAAHPHLAAREVHITLDGVVQAAPAPRFSATTSPFPAPPHRGEDIATIRRLWDGGAPDTLGASM